MGGAGPAARSAGADVESDGPGRVLVAPFFPAPRAAFAARLAGGAAWAPGMTDPRVSDPKVTDQSQSQSQRMSDPRKSDPRKSDPESRARTRREARDSHQDRRQQVTARAAGGLGRGAEAPGVKYGSMLWS